MAFRGYPSLVFDASVLIDYCHADRSLLHLISTKVSPIWTPEPVVKEVRELSVDEYSELGIFLVDMPLASLVEASKLTASISFPDRLCFLLARDEKAPCITSDRTLRKFCESQGVKPFWGLEPLLWLVAAGALSPEAALTSAQAIQASNPRFITTSILSGFTDRLRAL